VASDLIQSILRRLNDVTVRELKDATRIAHPGESGRAREGVIRKFLRGVVPQMYGIDTGFVIDATGAISKQIDVVIYRGDYHPVYAIGDVKHFMVESVVAVIENKATIDSVERLRMAMQNIASVKTLDRTNRGKNYTLNGSIRGEDVNPDDFAHQIFGAILTEQSLREQTLVDEWLAFIRDPPRREWPNLFASVDGQVLRYSRLSRSVLTADTSEAEALGFTQQQNDGPPGLIAVADYLADFLRIAPLIDFKPVDYHLSGQAQMKHFRFLEGTAMLPTH
jgi:hypothetical protein